MGKIADFFKSSEEKKKEKINPVVSKNTKKVLENINSQKKSDTLLNSTFDIENNIVFDKKGEEQKFEEKNELFESRYNTYLKPIDAKLVIILLENSLDTYKYRSEIIKILESFIIDNLVCVISYSKDIKVDYYIDYKDALNNLTFNNKDNYRNLFGSIEKLDRVLLENNYKIIDADIVRYNIKTIDIIGFGTCSDNISIFNKVSMQRRFSNIAYKSNVRTKYFCLTEDDIINAAEIGFHSIGVMEKEY